jgi:vancomycin resistance protein YoaR
LRVVRLAALMRAEVGVERARRGRRTRAGRGYLRAVLRRRRLGLWAAAGTLIGLIAAGVLFAGSPERIPAGVTLAGVNVGGLTAEQAESKLRTRAAQLASVPVVFTAEQRRWAITPNQLEVRVDWNGAVEEALAIGEGPLPLRGLKRVKVRLFGEDLEPHADYFEAGLAYRVNDMSRRIERPAREASIVLRRLEPVVVPAEAGRELVREDAKSIVIGALAGFERTPVALPVRVDEPEVTASRLEPVADQVRTALSAAIRFRFRDTQLTIPPVQVAPLLDLPRDGRTQLRVSGTEAVRFFRNLARGVARTPVSATFEPLAGGRVRVVPGHNGRALDVEASGRSLLAGALSTSRREAELVVGTVEPRLTTDEARALRITRLLSAYRTAYSGTYDRIRNLQLAAAALDGTLIGPGKEFSFNREVGPRTKERGYRPAPVIINGEYKDGIGGGVSQVATTVFNAVWEAGLKITGRTPHALYISRYPLGRDATVNYPEIDLRFLNDTKGWIYIRARYDDTGIAIMLLGRPTNRRVVSVAGELEEVGPPELERELDPTLFVGQRVIEDLGEPGRAVTVTRTVYVGDDILYRETWHTTYRSEPRIVRVGTMPKPTETKPPPPPPPATTTRTTTTPTTTGGGGGG